MKTPGLTALTIGMFLKGWGIASPPSAEACGRPLCIAENSIVPLPPDGVVPANVPALVVLPPQLERVDATSLRLRTVEGADVEARLLEGAHGSGLLVPAAPLVPGARYHLEGTTACGAGMGEPAVSRADFTVGAEAALPTATGVLRPGTEHHGVIRVWDDGPSCSTNMSGSRVTLGFTPAPELVPLLPWVHWRLEVDGKTWATAPHGAVDSSGGATPSDGFRTRRELLTVHAVCGDVPVQQPPLDKGLAPGRHVATLHPVLEQSGAALPTLEVSFELTCPGAGPDVDPGTPGEEDAPADDELPLGKGCSQTGGGLAVVGVLATLRLWRRGTGKSLQDPPSFPPR